MILRPRRSQRGYHVFNMTPMIDVVLQLIIFFMYTSQFATMNRSPIDLPEEPGEMAEQADRTMIVVDIDPQGQLLIDRQRIDTDRFLRMVQVEVDRAGGDGSQVELLVRADRSCPASHINLIATELTRIGVVSWKLGTADPRR